MHLMATSTNIHLKTWANRTILTLMPIHKTFILCSKACLKTFLYKVVPTLDLATINKPSIRYRESKTRLSKRLISRLNKAFKLSSRASKWYMKTCSFSPDTLDLHHISKVLFSWCITRATSQKKPCLTTNSISSFCKIKSGMKWVINQILKA